jgi:hypothetical protein
VENFGWNFSANDYSEPEDTVLSSAAMVTAAEKVQARVAAKEKKEKTKRRILNHEDTKNHEGIRSASFSFVILRVLGGYRF